MRPTAHGGRVGGWVGGGSGGSASPLGRLTARVHALAAWIFLPSMNELRV